MTRTERRRRLAEIYDQLLARYGHLRCPLHHADPFQLLVAVVLSGQCRDDRVNQVTPELFRRWPDAAALAGAAAAELEEVIRPCGLFRHKAANLIKLAQQVVAVHGGRLPETIDELTALPGVGRKSANVVLGDAFDQPGFPVDTHVRRVLNLLGVVAETDPEKIEALVNAAVPPERWANLSHLIIQHGRDVCHARRPDCAACVLRAGCPAARPIPEQR